MPVVMHDRPAIVIFIILGLSSYVPKKFVGIIAIFKNPT